MMKIFPALMYWMLISVCSNAQSLTLEKNSEGAWIKEDGEKVLFYQARTRSMDGKYARANYIHPLYNVDGFELTEDFPKDHLHHRGIFWTWHQVIVGGNVIGDAWECKGFVWDVDAFGVLGSTENELTLQSKVLWKSPSWTDSNEVMQPFVEETTEITIHKKQAHFRVIDFRISLLALEENVKIGGSDNVKGYGGFSVRMKLPKDILFTSVDGAVEPRTEQVAAGPWMAISGTLASNEGKGGVIIMNHPENPMYPEKWILRRKSSMQNPVFPGKSPVLLFSDTPTVLKHRLVVYAGEMSQGTMKMLSETFE